MKIGHLSFRLQRSMAHRGVRGSLSAASRKILRGLARKPGFLKTCNPLHPFDAEFGTDTSGLVAAEDLLDGRRRRNIHNTGFYATAPSFFHQAVARLEIDFPRFTFIDLGAGKGRILLLASNLPFRRVLGVELIPGLQAIAARNIAVYQPPSRLCSDVECVLGDVCDFVFPSGPLVIFLWHPFVGPVFERVMSNLELSLEQQPREVYLVYLRPKMEHLVQRIPSLRKLWEGRFSMTEEEFAAHILPEKSEVCVAYATC